MEFTPIASVAAAAKIEVNVGMPRLAPELAVARVLGIRNPRFDLSVHRDDKVKT